MAQTHPDDVRMSLGDHLEELRYRIIIGIVGPLVASAIMLMFGKQVVSFLCRPLLIALQAQGLPAQVINPSVTSAFSVYIRVSFICGFIIGIPWFFYHLWKFIAPGLYPRERRFVYYLVPGSTALTLTGVSFMYFILLPFMLYFLINFSLGFDLPSLEPNAVEKFTLPPSDETMVTPDKLAQMHIPIVLANPDHPEIGQAWVKLPENVLRIYGGDRIYEANLRTNKFMTPLIQLETYVTFVMLLALAFALAFQTPLIMLGLGYIGILTHQQMSAARPYLIVVILIIAAVLTPPDVLSQVGLAVPMYLLYEFGLVLVKYTQKRAAVEGADDADEG